MQNPKERESNIEALYPGLQKEDLLTAAEGLKEYSELVLRIYLRIEDDPDQRRQLRTLTKHKRDRTIDPERSNNKPSPNT